jgi:ferritin-like metal-binding protein YciE
MSILDTIADRLGFQRKIVETSQPQKPTLPEQFEKSDKESYALDTNANVMSAFLNQPGLRRGSNITLQTLRRMSRANWVDRSCIVTLRDEITGIPWDIVPIEPRQPYSETFKKYLIKLLKKPNSNNENWRTFIDKVIEDILAVDAGVVEKTRDYKGRIIELFAVDGTTIKPLYDKYGLVGDIAYQQFMPNIKEPVADWNNDDMIYMMWNPQSGMDMFGLGCSPVEAGIACGTAFLYAEAYNMKWFSGNTIPQMIINLGKDVQPAQVDQFRTFLLSEMQGLEGAHTPIVGSFGDDFKTVELLKDPQNMAWQDYLKWQMQWKVALYRMSPQDIGFGLDQYKVEGQVQQQLSKNKAVNSLKGILKEYIDTEIIGDKGWDISFEDANLQFKWIDSTSVDPKDQAAVDKIYLDAGVVSINEVRAEQGKDPIKGGQTPRIVSGMAQLEIDPTPLEASGEVIKSLSSKEADKLIDKLGEDVDKKEFLMGMDEEMEHKDITGGDPVLTAKIVMAHLKEDPHYYTKLKEAFKKSADSYDYQSTQLDLPQAIADKVIEFGQIIPESELYIEPETNGCGRETDIHVSVMYGIDIGVTADEITEVIGEFKPITITLGKTSIFECEDYDVVKIEVTSPELKKLHYLIGDKISCSGNKFPDYKPHITIAYVKKGMGIKYAGENSFEGTDITINQLIFSNIKGIKTFINPTSNIQKSSLIVTKPTTEGVIYPLDLNQSAVCWVDDRGCTQPLFVTNFEHTQGFTIKPDFLDQKKGIEPPEQIVAENLRKLQINTPEVLIMTQDQVMKLLPVHLYSSFHSWLNIEAPFNSQQWRTRWGKQTRQSEKYIVTGFISGKDLTNQDQLKDMAEHTELYKDALMDLARIWLAEKKFKLGDRKPGHYIVTNDKRGFGVDYTFENDDNSWKKTSGRLPQCLLETSQELYDAFKHSLSEAFDQTENIEKALNTKSKKKIRGWKPIAGIEEVERNLAEKYQQGIYNWYKKVVHIGSQKKKIKKAAEFDPDEDYICDGQYVYQNGIKYPLSVLDRVDQPNENDLIVPAIAFSAAYALGTAYALNNLRQTFPTDKRITTPNMDTEVQAKRVEQVATSMSETMTKDVSAMVDKGIADGKTIEQISQDIRDTLAINADDPNYPGWRADRVAKTESQWSKNEGNRQTMKENGVKMVNVINSDNACDDCIAIAQDGPYTIDEIQGMIPAHPNCLCDIDDAGDGE